MERRNFLGALTAASFGVLLDGSLSEFALARSAAEADTYVAGQSDFKTSQVEVSGNTIFVRRYGTGAGNFNGSRLPAHKPDVAISRSETRRESQRDLRRSARLRSQRDTRLHTGPLSLFKARHGNGIG